VITASAIPEEIQRLPQWVGWKTENRPGKDGEMKPTKVLVSPNPPYNYGKSNDAGTWGTFADALKAAEMLPGIDGIGFVFNGDGIIGVDFDHVRDKDTGQIDPEAWDEIKALNSYTEVSPSGTGFHVLCRGKIPGDRRRKGLREIYESKRYFTVTGDHVDGTPHTINDAQAAIDELCKKWFAENPRPPPSVPVDDTEPEYREWASGSVPLDDDEIVTLATEAGNGMKFLSLFRGDTSGYSSQSEADSALCSLLAFYTKDPRQIDRIFRKSYLMRGKWHEKRGNETYGDITIRHALDLVIEQYGQQVNKVPRSRGSRKVDHTQAPQAGGGVDDDQDYTQFARWKRDTKTGEQVIIGIDRQRAISHFIEKYHPVSYQGTIWLYQDGIYSPDKGRINRDLTEISIGLDIQAQRTTYLEIVQMLKGVNLHDDDPFNRQEGTIPTLSGVLKLDFQNGAISGPFEHSHEYLFTYKMPVVYDPSADTQKLMDVFSTWVDADDIKYLIQLPALALIQSWGYDFKQAYLFEGPKNAGKTTYFNLIDGVIGEENRATITLQSLVFNRFSAAGLVGKLMNVVDELPSVTLSNLDSFKNMIGGHAVWVEKKGQDGYSAHLRAVHCFNCNKPPACKISDDDAWWDRWVYVRFPNMFPSDPKWKTEFLNDETRSAFFNLVLEKTIEIMRDGGKAARMDPEDVKQIWMASADILLKFLEEETVRDPEGEILKEDFYTKLVKYCLDQGKTAPTKHTVTGMLGRISIKHSRPKVDDTRPYAYRGVRWKQVEKNTDNMDTPQEEDPSCPCCPTFFKPLRIFQSSTSTVSECTKELEKTRTTWTHPCDDPDVMSWQDALSKYDLPPDTNLSHHIKFTKTGQYCTCKGCGKPAGWQTLDKVRPLPLCDQHYQELKAAGDRPS
jgi:hypothetical protein